jgi:hypothetical protein
VIGRGRTPELTADLTAEVFAAALLAAERYRPGERPAPPTMVWYGADRKVLKTVTPPSQAAMKKLCLDHPRACAQLFSVSSSSGSSRSVQPEKRGASPAGGSSAPSKGAGG